MSLRRSSRSYTQAATTSTEAALRQEDQRRSDAPPHVRTHAVSDTRSAKDGSAPARAAELPPQNEADGPRRRGRSWSESAAGAASAQSTPADPSGPSGPRQQSKRRRKNTGNEYEWETVLDTRQGGKELLVKWKDFPESEATWEPAGQLPPEVIEHYRSRTTKPSSCGTGGDDTTPDDEAETSLSSGGQGCSVSHGALAANVAADRPRRRRFAPTRLPKQLAPSSRLSKPALQDRLTAMGFSAEQVSSALSWAAKHPKVSTAAILDHVLAQKQPPRRPRKHSSSATVRRSRKPAKQSPSRSADGSTTNGPTTAADALALADVVRNRVKVQVSLIRREEAMLEAYSGERAQARSAENGGLVVPQAELQRAMARILTSKRKIRANLRKLWEVQSGEVPHCFHHLSPAALETENSNAADGERGIDYADIICSACGSGDDTVADERDIDILLCDAPGCRLAFHNTAPCIGTTNVVAPDALQSLLSEESSAEEQEWWCPLCTVMYDCVDLINESFERSYVADLRKWASIFSEVEEPGTSRSRAAMSVEYQEEELQNLDQFSEEKLRHHLQKRGLSTKGKRAVLKTRLQRTLATSVTRSQQQLAPQQPQAVRHAMNLSRILHDASEQRPSSPGGAAGSGSGARAVALAEDNASNSDVELDDTDNEETLTPVEQSEHGAASALSQGTDCLGMATSQAADGSPTKALSEARCGGVAASSSPRGRGKRQRQAIDYTCLDIMLFGLPGDVPDEDMVHPLSLGGRRKAATATDQKPGELRKNRQETDPTKAEETRGCERANSSGHSSHSQDTRQAKANAESQKSGSSTRISPGSSSLALLLGDATSDGEGDWSPRRSKAKKKTKSNKAAGVATAVTASTDEEHDDDNDCDPTSSSSSSSSDEDT